MNAELLAGNIAAHWVQAGVLGRRGVDWRIRLLNLNEPARAGWPRCTLTLIAIVAVAARAAVASRWSRRSRWPSAAVDVAASWSTKCLTWRRFIEPRRCPRSIRRGRLWRSSSPASSCDCCGCFTASSGSRDSAGSARQSPPPAVASALEAELGVSRALHPADRRPRSVDVRIASTDGRASRRIRRARSRRSSAP